MIGTRQLSIISGQGRVFGLSKKKFFFMKSCKRYLKKEKKQKILILSDVNFYENLYHCNSNFSFVL